MSADPDPAAAAPSSFLSALTSPSVTSSSLVSFLRCGHSFVSSSPFLNVFSLCLDRSDSRLFRSVFEAFLSELDSRSPAEIQSFADELASRLFPFDSFSVGVPASLAIANADNPIERVAFALQQFRSGQFLVVCDSLDRENEADLILAGELATPAQLAFMVNETSGIICTAITKQRASELQLPQMVQRNTESHQTAFTVSVDYRHGTSTGVSASDRCATIRALADPNAKPDDFARPGHIFPLQARDGGVLERPGHTEASVDLCLLSGLRPVGVLSEIVKRDGSMARPGEIRTWANRKGLFIIAIEELIAYRKHIQQEQNGRTASGEVSSSSNPNQSESAS